MLDRIYIEGDLIQLAGKDRKFNENVYTILVGRNGTGKSRLLGNIVNNIINDGEFILNAGRDPNRIADQHIRFSNRNMPSRVIAVSTSPFDRFPLKKGGNANNRGYSYLGIRDILSSKVGISYLSKIIASLLESLDDDFSSMKNISSVLKYLGYESHIEIRFAFRSTTKFFAELAQSDTPTATFEEWYFKYTNKGLPLNREFFTTTDGKISSARVAELQRIVTNRLHREKFFGGWSILNISDRGLHDDLGYDGDVGELVFLLRAGILRLQDVSLSKVSSLDRYSIKDASSGEQSVIMSMLGIASHICENSIICIEEPENCLHPEWQEMYIRLLIKTFGFYRNCHFIIATHSPQIISNLRDTNSYIFTMEDASLKSANYLINHSADYQLVNVFHTPGQSNEYLIRLSVNTFAKVVKNKKFDEEDFQNYFILAKHLSKLQADDPVQGLISSLSILYNMYSNASESDSFQ